MRFVRCRRAQLGSCGAKEKRLKAKEERRKKKLERLKRDLGGETEEERLRREAAVGKMSVEEQAIEKLLNGMFGNLKRAWWVIVLDSLQMEGRSKSMASLRMFRS